MGPKRKHELVSSEKVLATQLRGPKFNPQHADLKKKKAAVVAGVHNQSWGGTEQVLWGLLAS